MANLEALREYGIDTDEGLACCADDPAFYEEMLGEFLSEGEERLAELWAFFEARDWKAYTICAHSVKSTSRMIGAKALSERARELELAGKAEDAAAIEGAHAAFLAEYAALLDTLRAAL